MEGYKHTTPWISLSKAAAAREKWTPGGPPARRRKRVRNQDVFFSENICLTFTRWICENRHNQVRQFYRNCHPGPRVTQRYPYFFC